MAISGKLEREAIRLIHTPAHVQSPRRLLRSVRCIAPSPAQLPELAVARGNRPDGVEGLVRADAAIRGGRRRHRGSRRPGVQAKGTRQDLHASGRRLSHTGRAGAKEAGLCDGGSGLTPIAQVPLSKAAPSATLQLRGETKHLWEGIASSRKQQTRRPPPARWVKPLPYKCAQGTLRSRGA